MPYNIILNFSDPLFQRDAIYVLAASPVSDYILCSISASILPNCTTEYNVSVTGGLLSTQCADTGDYLPYNLTVLDNVGPGVRHVHWAEVAAQWAKAINLNDGPNDDDSSNSRLLTQLIPQTPHLNDSIPSIAEAIAMLAGCTLLISGIDSPFTYPWDGEPKDQQFSVSLRSQEYASGPSQDWQKALYPVLGAVVIINLYYLFYFVKNRCLVTDFMEPQNLFTLSLNSPPSQSLQGACGGGPDNDQLGSNWTVQETDERHFLISNLPRSRQKQEGRRLWLWIKLQECLLLLRPSRRSRFSYEVTEG